MKHLMKQQSKTRVVVGMAVAVALLAAVSVLGFQDGSTPESFNNLKPAPEIIYLLANSSIIIGPDVHGAAEEITFTGTVSVPKFPLTGFDRRKLADGKYQIDFELSKSDLHGESYLLDGPVLLGEHPDLRSLGTITQRDPGKDYPADFIVQRKVLIETPTGKLHNEAPVPVRGTIDSIPPVWRPGTVNGIDIFKGEQLPIAMLDGKGEIGGWFYSTAHTAFAVDPTMVFRFNFGGKVTLSAHNQEEEVQVSGPMECLRIAGVDEVVSMALRGESKLLGGRIMFIESFSEKEKYSRGAIPTSNGLSRFDLYTDVKSPSGTLHVTQPLKLEGNVQALRKTDNVTFASGRTVVVYDGSVQYTGGGQSIVDELGRPVAEIRSVQLASTTTRKGPCCPR